MSQQQFQAEVMDQLRMQEEWDEAFPPLTGSAFEEEIEKMWAASNAREQEFWAESAKRFNEFWADSDAKFKMFLKENGL